MEEVTSCAQCSFGNMLKFIKKTSKNNIIKRENSSAVLAKEKIMLSLHEG